MKGKGYRRGLWQLCGWQIGLLVLLLAVWYAATGASDAVAFFFGKPVDVAARLWQWFVTDADIYQHLGVTLVETLLAFVIGTLADIGMGLWLALAPFASAVLDPYLKAANATPRVILAPIFALWFGLGIWSKVALAVTLVFFVVFFNVYQGVREVSPITLANTRMLGAGKRDLMRHVYVSSAMSWVFSSLHGSVGLAFVGTVVGEYLGSASSVGYLILQAEGTLDTNTVIAGIVLLTVFALLLGAFVILAERHWMKWQPRNAQTEQL
jgi:NitT/TauT family transport system permease protein